MPRGRKKDHTIPTTRALIQNRDYRARKAQYLSDLEDKCRTLEMQNDDLRKEVHSLRVLLPTATVHNPAIVESSAQLMTDLSTVTQTLARFQHLVFSETNTFPPPMPQHHPPPTTYPTPSPHSTPHTSHSSPRAPTQCPYALADLDAPSTPRDRPPRFPRDILWAAEDLSVRRPESVSGCSTPSNEWEDNSTGSRCSGSVPPQPPTPRSP